LPHLLAISISSSSFGFTAQTTPITRFIRYNPGANEDKTRFIRHLTNQECSPEQLDHFWPTAQPCLLKRGGLLGIITQFSGRKACQCAVAEAFKKNFCRTFRVKNEVYPVASPQRPEMGVKTRFIRFQSRRTPRVILAVRSAGAIFNSGPPSDRGKNEVYPVLYAPRAKTSHCDVYPGGPSVLLGVSRRERRRSLW
jgi:hypothetical protein